MTRPIATTCLIIAMLPSGTLAAESRPGQKTQPASEPALVKATGVTAMLRVSTFAPLHEQLDAGLLDEFLRSHAVLGRALEDLDIPSESVQNGKAGVRIRGTRFAAKMQQGWTQHMTTFIPIEVFVDDERRGPVAHKLLLAIAKHLQEILQEQAKAIRAELEPCASELRSQQMEAQVHIYRTYQDQEALRKKAGRSDLRREPILDEIRKLEAQQRDLQIEQTALKARKKAILAQIEKTNEEAEAKRRSDPVAEELKQIVAHRQMEVRRVQMLHKQAAASEAEVHLREAQAAEARAQLARRQEEVAEKGKQELLSRLNGELATIAIQTAETDARLDAVTKRLAEIHATKLLDLVDTYEHDVADKIPALKQRIEMLTKQQDELKAQLNHLTSIRVDVVGVRQGRGGGYGGKR